MGPGCLATGEQGWRQGRERSWDFLLFCHRVYWKGKPTAAHVLFGLGVVFFYLQPYKIRTKKKKQTKPPQSFECNNIF